MNDKAHDTSVLLHKGVLHKPSGKGTNKTPATHALIDSVEGTSPRRHCTLARALALEKTAANSTALLPRYDTRLVPQAG
eukprot:2496806-Amphidinium_carterae.1